MSHTMQSRYRVSLCAVVLFTTCGAAARGDPAHAGMTMVIPAYPSTARRHDHGHATAFCITNRELRNASLGAVLVLVGFVSVAMTATVVMRCTRVVSVAVVVVFMLQR